MSKPRDPKDVAIAFVMSADIPVAAAFVETLASIVKARSAGKAAPAKPAGAAAATPRKSTRAAAPPAVTVPAAGDERPAVTGLPISGAPPS